jgi:hypothetical protein
MFPGRMFPSSSLAEKERRYRVMEKVMPLEGPVLKINGELVLIIPLSFGSDELVECSRGISEVQGEFLKIVIPEWLAGMLRIEEGDLVCVEDADGKFHITPSNPRRVH